MKKHFLSILFAGAMLLGTVGTAQAVPMYYTFEGAVSLVYDGAGIIADAGLAAGSLVSYTFLVDFDADGTETYNNGSVYTHIDTSSKDYFYTDYISGSALQEKDGGIYNDEWDIAELNYGVMADPVADPHSNFYNNPYDNQIQIFAPGMATDWVVGTDVGGFDYAYDSAGSVSTMWMDLTVTDITPASAPVPEPATMLLLGSGLVGMFGFRKKKETV